MEEGGYGQYRFASFQNLWRNKSIKLVLLSLIIPLFFYTILVHWNGSIPSATVTLARPEIFLTPASSSSSRSVEQSNSAADVGNDYVDGGDADDDNDDDYVDVGEDGEEEKENFMEDEFVFDIGNGVVLKKKKDGHITVLRNRQDDSEGNVTVTGTSTGDGLISLLNASAHSDLGSSNVPSQSIQKNQEKGGKNKNVIVLEEKVQSVMSISDMDRALEERRRSSESKIPRRQRSKLDRQLLYARSEIENNSPPTVSNDADELYGPAFRNVSRFRKSYELMERILKVYVYKEGDRPIFHKPFLTGIYASEGWFMKQMEENRQFVVNDPAKAHLFYLPFSSRILQEVLYVANSHSHRNLIEHLSKYVELISSKYPSWNRTGGRDHFAVGCHDWATHETGRSMNKAIRALCNADVLEGFQIGKDVSLPETHVSNGRDPNRNIGGKPAHQRTTLAFFAGQMHGYLRPIIIEQWQNKVPDMVISGPIPHRIKKKTKTRRRKKTKMVTTMTYPYMNYMKDSKYCICPRGYEVNSPRVVESIFYGCVPVIISDNFVPPFFEVMDWSAFSVILAEKDVPRLNEILVGISKNRFTELERGVRLVRRHFVWNRKGPIKYDLFHMILHSIWFNRLYEI